eukprot:16810-Pelagomonas_calceolata.AAC.4
MSSRSMRGLLTTSELCDLQAQQTSPTNKPNISQDPGARPVPLLHSLHADVPCANSDGFGSSSFSKGAIFPLSFTGPSQRQLNAEGMENGDTREPQLVCGVEEGSNGQAGHPKQQGVKDQISGPKVTQLDLNKPHQQMKLPADSVLHASSRRQGCRNAGIPTGTGAYGQLARFFYFKTAKFCEQLGKRVTLAARVARGGD